MDTVVLEFGREPGLDLTAWEKAVGIDEMPRERMVSEKKRKWKCLGGKSPDEESVNLPGKIRKVG